MAVHGHYSYTHRITPRLKQEIPYYPCDKPIKQESGQQGPMPIQTCAGCGAGIVERFLLHALDRYWHQNCLKCSMCNVPLADIGKSCFTKEGMILCRHDYTKMYGNSGACISCGGSIPPNEYVTRVSAGVFHLKCFSCSKCGTTLSSGDKYCLVAGSPVCEPDWHKMVKASNAAATAANAVTGNGGPPVRKAKVGRPRRSRE